jgi:hypothetical protein
MRHWMAAWINCIATMMVRIRSVPGRLRLELRKERLFFFEKKNQKTFGLWRIFAGERIHHGPRVLFLEKKTFLS